MRFRKKGWTFAQVPIWAVCDPNISDGALRLLAYLAWRQGNDNSCWPSVSRMAQDLRSSPKTIQRRLRELEETGYLVTRHRRGRSNEYTLVADPDGASEKHIPTARREQTPVRTDRGTPPKLTGTPVKSDQGPRSNLSGTPVRSDAHDDKKGQEENEREKGDEAFQLQWSRTLEALQLRMTRATFDLWFAGASARRDGDTLSIQLQNQQAVEWVSHRLQDKVLATVRRIFEEPDLSIAYEVRP